MVEAAHGGATQTDASLIDAELAARLRGGDEQAFVELLDGWSPAMLRLARTYLSSDQAAEDVVQETWLAVIRGVDRFEGRSSLRTWVYRILVNIAKAHRARESRTVPWPSSAEQDAAPTVDRGRFQSADEPYPGHWRRFPLVWPSPETDVVAHEVRDTIDTALAELPQRQRLVLTLRDMHGYSSAEVCEILEVSPQNQRVLLHRARAAVRARLEEYFGMPLTDGGQQR